MKYGGDVLTTNILHSGTESLLQDYMCGSVVSLCLLHPLQHTHIAFAYSVCSNHIPHAEVMRDWVLFFATMQKKQLGYYSRYVSR